MYNIEYLRKNNLIIAEFISGSRAYGTNTPDSDTDIRGIFVQPLEDILKYGFVEQVSDEKNDVCFYELGRFLHLLGGNNPNIIELLWIPDDCVIYKHELFIEIEKHRSKFLTSKVRFTFGQYAREQIKKATGLNKKMNWEKDKFERKHLLDFCYIIEKGKTILFSDWLAEYNNFTRSTFPEQPYLTQSDFSLAKIDHSRDLYAMYLHNGGITSNKETATDVKLVSIPKDRPFMGYLNFNKDAYSIHCREYNDYTTWLTKRNENRFKMNKEHGKQYDSKNMMHCIRLLTMTNEMLEKGMVIVRRSPEDIDFLMKIRRGELELSEIMSIANTLITALDINIEKNILPNSIDSEFVSELLLQLRKKWYNNRIE